MPSLPNLKPIRERRVLSQAELAERSGVAQSTISKLEQGRPARYVTVRRLAETLDVTLGELLGEITRDER